MRFCTQCGGMNDDQNAVCSQCGTPFPAGNSTPAAQPPQGVQQGQGYAPVQNVPPQPPQYGTQPQAHGAQPPPQYGAQQGYAPPVQQAQPQPYNAQPYGQPAPQGGPQQPWPPEGQLVPAKKKGRLWLWLGPVIGVVAIGVVLLILWLAGVFGGGGTDNPFIDALNSYAAGDDVVGFVAQEEMEDFGTQVSDAFTHARGNDMHMSYTYVPLKNGDLSGTLEEYITSGEYTVLVVVNAQGKYPEMERLARQEGVAFHYIDASPPVPVSGSGSSTAVPESDTRPSDSDSASASASVPAPDASSGPASQSGGASVPATDNPFILALREYAMDGQQNVKFISHNPIDDFGTLAREALSFREGEVEHLSYTSTTRSDLGSIIDEAVTEGYEVIILVNSGSTYPEHAEKCKAAGIGLHYIEVPVGGSGEAAAADLAGNLFYETMLEQLEKGGAGAVLVGRVGEPCMEDALRAQEYMEDQGYRTANLLNEEAGDIYDQVLLMLASNEVDIVIMANTEYPTLIEAIYAMGFDIIYITT